MVRLRSGALLVGLASSGCRINFDSITSADADPFDATDATDATDGTASGDSGGEGTTVSIVGPLVTEDTVLNSAGAALNYGGGAAFNLRNDMISEFTGLMRFDLTTIAPGTTIVSAELRLTTGNAALASGVITLYELQEAWTEGTQNGTTGTASWNERMAGVAWTTQGAGPGSRATVQLATFQPYQTDTVFAIAVPPAQIQKWVDMPVTNFGVALVASGAGMGDTVAIAASESAATTQPKLVVTTNP